MSLNCNEVTYEVKECPVCHSLCFSDMDVCYGCLHQFKQGSNENKDVLPSKTDEEKQKETIAVSSQKNEVAEMEKVKQLSSLSLNQGSPLSGTVVETGQALRCGDSQDDGFKIIKTLPLSPSQHVELEIKVQIKGV